MGANPYQNLDPQAFWRPAVAERSMFEIADLWRPKFPISRQDPVATFGSCFAQHIGRRLQARGFNWLITEPAPLGLGAASARKFNYNVFSCRTGNIYTTSLLRQWVSWALRSAPVPEEFWEASGRFYDPFRPAVEPDGFDSLEELRRSQAETLQAFRACVVQAQCFVFTLGLTESWANATGRYEYPMCPGAVAGEFQEGRHVFSNQGFAAVRENLVAAISMMREVNPGLRVLLTVSPVPLTATYSGRHVLVATTYSKSVLRAVAGQLAENMPFVDYFPSYEIFTSPAFRGAFYEPNLRTAAAHGVEFAMTHFFGALGEEAAREAPMRADVACEEELLAAFGEGAPEPKTPPPAPAPAPPTRPASRC